MSTVANLFSRRLRTTRREGADRTAAASRRAATHHPPRRPARQPPCATSSRTRKRPSAQPKNVSTRFATCASSRRPHQDARPPSTNSTWSQHAATSSGSCVITRLVTPRAAQAVQVVRRIQHVRPIQAARGLVEHAHLAAAGHGAGDGHALLLAAGQRHRVPVDEIRQAEPGQNGLDLGFGRLAAQRGPPPRLRSDSATSSRTLSVNSWWFTSCMTR